MRNLFCLVNADDFFSCRVLHAVNQMNILHCHFSFLNAHNKSIITAITRTFQWSLPYQNFVDYIFHACYMSSSFHHPCFNDPGAIIVYIMLFTLQNHVLLQDSGWSMMAPDMDRRAVPSSLERCASCISKLGAPSMSRSSTVTNTNTPTGAPFSPAWTMDSTTNVTAPPIPCQHHYHVHHPQHHHPRANTSCDRMSLSSHGSGGSSGNSEYSVPRFVTPAPAPPGGGESCWYDRPRTITATPPPSHPPIPPKSPRSPPISQSNLQPNPANGLASHPPPSLSEGCRCSCCPPSRPPKPLQLSAASNTSDSPSKKKIKKPPMPLPIPDPPPVQQHPASLCTCHHPQHQQRPDVNPYENYDVPKSLLGHSNSRVSLVL